MSPTCAILEHYFLSKMLKLHKKKTMLKLPKTKNNKPPMLKLFFIKGHFYYSFPNLYTKKYLYRTNQSSETVVAKASVQSNKRFAQHTATYHRHIQLTYITLHNDSKAPNSGLLFCFTANKYILQFWYKYRSFSTMYIHITAQPLLNHLNAQFSNECRQKTDKKQFYNAC